MNLSKHFPSHVTPHTWATRMLSPSMMGPNMWTRNFIGGDEIRFEHINLHPGTIINYHFPPKPKFMVVEDFNQLIMFYQSYKMF